MSPLRFTELRGDMDILDYWTEVSIEAHFRELVKEAQEASLTRGYTKHPEETQFTD